jgi:hypothetical protein
MNENFTREQVLKAVAAAWDDANANRHGNPFVALEAVLAARGGGLMATIDLNFTLDYCKRWGMREAVREVIQNARDVELQGGSFRVEHDARRNLLTVTSEGQHVTSRALVFGATDKADDPRTIGQFGDG